jgi:kumamolisin
LSREEFSERFGSTQEDLDLVADFAARHDLVVAESSRARRSVLISAPAGAMERALGVTLQYYQAGPERYRGHDGYVHVPADLANIIEGVLGLDNRRLGWRASNGGSGGPPFTPLDVAKAYNFPDNLDASGQTIGILEFAGGFVTDDSGRPSDVDAYLSPLHIPLPVVKIGYGQNTLSTLGNSPHSPDLEVTGDIVIAGCIAQGATIVLYFSPDMPDPMQGQLPKPNEMDWSMLLLAAIHDSVNKPSVLSISWGAPENLWPSAAFGLLGNLFAEAGIMGITVLASSGDYGASGYPATDQNGDGQPHVHYPASDPNVTGCGGTKFSVNPSFDELTWNDSSNGGATGGGVSEHFQDNSWYPWQEGIQVYRWQEPPFTPSTPSGRGVPDIAGNASPSSGYDIIFYGKSLSAYHYGLFGGTSAVAPFYAGLIAVINSVAPITVGGLNGILYESGGTAMFHDVIDQGNNNFESVAGDVVGYMAMPGWDACTGWGSINGKALLAVILSRNSGCVATLRTWVENVLKAMGIWQ